MNTMDIHQLPAPADIREAAERIAGVARRTPVWSSPALDEAAGAELHFKCEPMQLTGAFKVRGALNAVLSMSDAQAKKGVATHSSGNHGAALAFAARERGIPCTVVMPDNSVKSKVANVRRYGAEVVFCEPSQASREDTVADVVERTGAEVIPPYDDARIIAGQGTCALELLEQVPELDVLVVPVGGGGLITGTAIAARSLAPGIGIRGAEPAGSDDAARSLSAGRRITDITPDTVCDGLRAIISELTFRGIRDNVDGIITVEDDATIDAMRLAWLELKLTIEPSSAVVLAAVLAEPDAFRDRSVGVILSGGNVDLDHLPW